MGMIMIWQCQSLPLRVEDARIRLHLHCYLKGRWGWLPSPRVLGRVGHDHPEAHLDKSHTAYQPSLSQLYPMTRCENVSDIGVGFATISMNVK